MTTTHATLTAAGTGDGTAPPPPDDVRWLALAIREGLYVIIRAIERRYRLERK